MSEEKKRKITGSWQGVPTYSEKNRWGMVVAVYAKTVRMKYGGVRKGRCINCGYTPRYCSPDDHK